MVTESFKVTLNIRADTPIVVFIPWAVNSIKVHTGDMSPVVKAQAKIKSAPKHMATKLERVCK